MYSKRIVADIIVHSCRSYVTQKPMGVEAIHTR